MKKTFFIFCLLFSVSGFTDSIKGHDNHTYINDEIMTFEPLPYNNQTYTKFKKQKFYDYYRVEIQSKSAYEILHERFSNWFSKVFKKTISKKEFDIFIFLTGIILFIIFAVIIYMNKPGIFYFNKKNHMVYSIEDEDIETQDLDYLTEKSIKDNLFSDAIRWQYLKTLKILHESDYISYDSNKTVNEYVYEIKDLNLRKQFRNLSGEFIYYRYGKGQADAEIFSHFRTVAETIQKIRAV